MARTLLKRKQPRAASSSSGNGGRTIVVLVLTAALVIFMATRQNLDPNPEMQLGFWTAQLPEVTSAITATASLITASSERDTNNNQQETFHVLFGVSNNDPYFFEEFEVALKSIFLNAPHHMALEIHVMCGEGACEFLDTDVWPRIFGSASRGDTQKVWYTPVTISIYNTQPFLVSWKEIVQAKTKFRMVLTHTIGAYFRLFCDQVLPSHVQRIFYVDTDVVVTANLAQILDDAPPPDDQKWILQMQNECSGVMFVHVPQLPRFWELVAQVEDWGKMQKRNADQDLILGVIKHLDTARESNGGQGEPSSTYIQHLAEQWDLTTTRDYEHNTREKLLAFRPDGVGLLHYNGGAGKNKQGLTQKNYFHDQPIFVEFERQRGWGFAGNFYIQMPWSWVFYMGQCLTAGGRFSSDVPKPTIRIRDHDLTSAAEKYLEQQQ